MVTLAAFASLAVVGARLGPAGLIVSLVMAVVAWAFVIALSRAVVQLMGIAVESRLGRELAAIQYALRICLSFIWVPIGVVATQGGGGTGGAALASLPPLGDVARALPTGWSGVAVESVGRGEWLLVVAALAGLTALTLAAVAVWAVLLARRLRGVAASHTRRFRPASVWDMRGLALSAPLGAVRQCVWHGRLVAVADPRHRNRSR